MSHSHKHAKSKNEWFRMDVPKRLQALAGTTSWKQSLGTSNPALAAIKRAQLVAYYKAEVVRLDGLLAAQNLQSSRGLVGQALEIIAKRLGSMDDAVRAHLLLLTHQARHSWGHGSGAEADRDLGFEPDEVNPEESPAAPFPGFDGAEERADFVVRLRWLENRGFADGLVYQEIAAKLLERKAWHAAHLSLLCLLDVVGTELKLGSEGFEAAAEELLSRLAHHTFADWHPRSREAITKVVPEQSALTNLPASVGTPDIKPSSSPRPINVGQRSDDTQVLTMGLARWIRSMNPGKSAITQASRSVARFVELFGDKHVSLITSDDIFDYRDFLKDMPRGLSLPAIKAAGKTLRQAAEEVRHERDERLSPTSIKKDLSGLSAIFSALISERWVLSNPAEGVPVEGYSKSKKFFPFRPDMMRKLYESPMFTGCEGLRGRKRTRPGPYVFQDTLYWSFLFAATVGHRMSEVAKAMTADVEVASGPNGEKIVGVFILDAKNEFSKRVIIVHPHLLALGFMEYVEQRRKEGEKQLFTLPGGGTRKLSERLNAYIDDVIIDDRRFVFHSLRHEFADRSEIDIGVDLSKAIMGHARGRLYGLGAPLHHAAAELNKIDLSFIDWPRLQSAVKLPAALAA